MGTPLVSVIIPTYNRAGLLPTAVHSALVQTFIDIEVLVVDDASELPVKGALSDFRDKRLRWIRHASRRGGAAARNTGIRNTAGEFVAFLDDDDEWYPDKLAQQVDLLRRSPDKVGAVYTGYDVVQRNTQRVVSRMTPLHRGDVSSVLLRGNCIGPTSSMLLRRKCFEDGGIFDETLPSFQEYDLWIRLSRPYEFDYVSQTLFNYYVHSNRIWTNPAAIQRGIDVLVKKYGESAIFRKTASECYLSVAVQLCEARRRVEARTALRRAISLNPVDVRHYLYFFLSYLGQNTYAAVQQTKLKVKGCLGGISTDGFCRR